MAGTHDLRAGEVAAELPAEFSAGLYFIGRIRTPWQHRAECPRRGAPDGPVCRIEVDPRWAQALSGLAGRSRIQVLYWMHEARRDLVLQSPRRDGATHGTFSCARRCGRTPSPRPSSSFWR